MAAAKLCPEVSERRLRLLFDTEAAGFGLLFTNTFPGANG